MKLTTDIQVSKLRMSGSIPLLPVYALVACTRSNLPFHIPYIQGIHKRMVRYQKWRFLKPHHSFVYALYIYIPTIHDISQWSVDSIQSYGSLYIILCRSQWPCGLRRGSAAARLLGLWVRIPTGAWMSVCCECCVLSGRGLCDGLVTRPEESYRVWCV
jgi:hypothetical protein